METVAILRYFPYSTAMATGSRFVLPRSATRTLENRLFEAVGAPCRDNKCTFELEDENGEIRFYTFYDFKTYIGTEVEVRGCLESIRNVDIDVSFGG